MPPIYPSQRNRQPFLRGTSPRVGGYGHRALAEISNFRKTIEAACIRFGSLYAHWRKFTADWNEGPCPRCGGETTIMEGAIDPRCPVCFGTGFEGGYSRPSIQWMIVQDHNEELDRTDLGFLRIRRSDSISPYLPVIGTSDLVGRVTLNEEGWGTQERFYVEGGVKQVRLRENYEIFKHNSYDHMKPDSEVGGYTFAASYLTLLDDEDRRPIEYFVPFEDPIWLADQREETR